MGSKCRLRKRLYVGSWDLIKSLRKSWEVREKFKEDKKVKNCALPLRTNVNHSINFDDEIER